MCQKQFCYDGDNIGDLKIFNISVTFVLIEKKSTLLDPKVVLSPYNN